MPTGSAQEARRQQQALQTLERQTVEGDGSGDFGDWHGTSWKESAAAKSNTN